MKKIKLYAVLLVGIIAMFGCSKYDDTQLRNDVNDLKSRVEKMETWCNTTNGQITALQGLVSALEQKNTITGTTPIIEGTKEVGYTITFSKGDPITIMHGKDGIKGLDGVTPVIGVKEDTDGHYYWTVKIGDADAVWITDADGNNIRTTGDKGADGEDGKPGEDGPPGNTGNSGHSPVLSVDTFEGKLYWKVDGQWLLNGGNKVPTTGAQSDAIFAEIDYTSDPDNVTFTLADGVTTITLPKSSAITVGFDSYDIFYCSETDNQITIVLPISLKETDYNTIVATVSNEIGTDMDIQTRSVSVNTWGVEITKPTFESGTLVAGSAKVTLRLPQDKTNYKALLKVTLIGPDGKEYSASRVVWFKADNDANVIDNTTGSLSGKISNASNVKQLSVIGNMEAADFVYIKDNMQNLEVLDLSRTTITEIPQGAMAFYNNPSNGWNYTTNTTLKTIILPETLTTIKNSAFAMCANLQEINMPKNVHTLGRWMFEGCSSLEEVTIPQGVSELPASAFYGAGIKRITIPSSVTSLGADLLRECTNLESAEILANVAVLPNNFFMASPKLHSVKLSTTIHTLNGNAFCNTGLTEYTIPSHITSIKEGAFCENTKLHTIVLPAGVQTAWNVFLDCKSLKNVTIPEGVTELGAEMFRGCIALESIELPSTITSIHDRAFQGCSALILIICKATTAPTLSGHNSGGENDSLHFYQINSSCVLKRPAGSNYSAWSSNFNEVQDL